jgi:four helix bundle protein
MFNFDLNEKMKEHVQEKQNLIKEKSYRFAIDAVKLYQQLRKEGEFVLSKQMLRSATSIGANVEEATAAQSRRDFAAKMAIASKEARETNYWLRLLPEFCTQITVMIGGEKFSFIPADRERQPAAR